MPAQPIINPTVDDYFNAYTAFTKDLGYEILNWAADEKIYEKDGTALKTLATKVNSSPSALCVSHDKDI